jgi:GNAT superfamily N-acetyltransferase
VTPAGERVTIRHSDSVEDLSALEPLWGDLQEHHETVTPDLGGDTPKRERAESWQFRRSKYERWLGDLDTFFLIAELDGEPVGYAFVTIGPGHASWETGLRMASLETLSVLAGQRGGGVGSGLLDAVWERLAELGVEEMQVTTTSTNVESHRFYEREGFEQRFVVYFGSRRVG